MKMKRLALAVAAIGYAGFVAGVATAADDDEPKKVERIEVTGSSIKRIAKEGALPVQTFSKKDIEKTGATSVTELIQSLPVQQGGSTNAESVGSGGGFAGASIHDIGQERTLILLNGRRVAQYAGQTLTGYGASINLNSLPLAAIERVEILTDGASALYGSDAVAGVINFITRRNQTAGEVSITTERPKGGVGGNWRLSATKGIGDLNTDGFNVLASFTRERQHLMMATDREFSKTGDIFFPDQGRNLEWLKGSPRGIPANVVINGDLVNPYLAANGHCPDSHLKIGNACYFDFTSQLIIYPESTRDSAMVSFSKTLGENRTVTLDTVWSKFEQETAIAPPPGSVLVASTSPFYAQLIPLGADGRTLSASWRVADAGRRTTNDVNTAKHVTLGLKGTDFGWDYDTALTYSRAYWDESYKNGYLISSKLQAATASGLVNPFVLPGQQSAAGMQLIKDARYIGKFKEADTSLSMYELRGSRPVLDLPGGSAYFGTGFDVRRETNTYKPSAIAQGKGGDSGTDTIFGDAAAEVPYDLSRRSWGAFAELVTPIVKDFEVTSSVRYDTYKHNETGNTYSDTTYKLSGRYQPVKQVLFRGSLGTGFRAPSLAQGADIVQSYGVTNDNYTCPFTGPDAALCRPGKVQWDVFAGGNKDLKPETSKQWSIGMVFEPTSFLSGSIDLWQVKLDETIGQMTEQEIMAHPDSYRNFFTTYTDPDTGETFWALKELNANLGKQNNKGIDYKFNFQQRLPFGRLTSSLEGTYLLTDEYELLKGSGFKTSLGRLGESGTVSFRNMIRLSTTLDHGAFSHTINANYKSGYADQVYTADSCDITVVETGDCADVSRRVASYTTWDWQTRYIPVKNLELILGVKNLFDRDPPFTLKGTGGQQVGFDARYASPLGRTWHGTVTYKF